ncbi:LamG domain-containing protein [Wenyingzhuangia sp. IMCC45574]
MKKITCLLLVFLVGSISSKAQQEEVVNLNESLLLHYKFDSNTNDSSGNDYHGTAFGSGQYTEGRATGSTALRFDGLDDYVAFPNISTLKPNLPVTISFDIKYESSVATKRVVFNTSYEEDYNSGVFFTTQSSTGKYALGFGDGDYNYTSSSIQSFIGNEVVENDTWHFLTIVVRGAQDMSIYEDGVKLTGSYGGSGGNLSYGSLSGVIGKHDQSNVSGAYYFKGVIDEFSYWDKALSEIEVAYLYNQYINGGSLSIDQHINLSDTIKIKVENSILSIESKEKRGVLEMYNILGERVYKATSFDDVNLTDFSSKILILKLQDSKGNFFVKKIIR